MNYWKYFWLFVCDMIFLVIHACFGSTLPNDCTPDKPVQATLARWVEQKQNNTTTQLKPVSESNHTTITLVNVTLKNVILNNSSKCLDLLWAAHCVSYHISIKISSLSSSLLQSSLAIKRPCPCQCLLATGNNSCLHMDLTSVWTDWPVTC